MPRRLDPQEREVIGKLLQESGCEARIAASWPTLLVEDLNDGGMGSIRFLAPNEPERHYGEVLAQAAYTDLDGVPVSLVLSIDKQGNLFELDVWKVDFSPLKRYPQVAEIVVQSIG